MATRPTEPGYYWAKLKTPSGGTLRDPSLPGGKVYLNVEGTDWASLDWEIVEVWDNNGDGEYKFGVNVFGIPVTQWPDDFFWGPKVKEAKP